ncbi:precorrin-2 dehydrogenase/sirohydrochlorin ferrochelatase family protein [Paenibacillus mucilaginosus]|uniref:precorrin-2 dehydrogenase n=1 Tax=Paenibacillus mucilaginosus (strain KNP414) TaxID=1036673 RepID=F8FNS2_PAEMK|nr:bifunctional precorrin-2 dehydrogenase/sirohydrochlorin ferrochelatase [Paenibacillus mucilaginosus]AEI44991.1 siroheme synthase, N-terminal domain protein [Paenibacillus mucilaginosus KNP414]MCG7213102.1 bifunctional precorrin-2 dehydrogenase/sirohydrochlorin ferrochelatase [Paenibacillus mucilaginosus]WDM26496.1 bifunctional precorrin-2 dehydrogenase/sirohydrochlorin ferrochelatase [Paenibacillus mucilaginosus]
MGKAYYPILLDLQNRICVIVGGGQVAERKAASLLEAGAMVKIIAPEVTPRIEAWGEEGRIGLRRERYSPGMTELREAQLIFAATDHAGVNAQVKREAEELGTLFNSADDQESGGFIVPAVVRRGRLTVAVSTSGASPALAAALKRRLEAVFPAAYEPYLELLHDLRTSIQEWVPDTRIRQEMFRGILAWPLLEVLEREHGEAAAGWKSLLLERLRRDPSPAGVERTGEWLLEQVRQPGSGGDSGHRSDYRSNPG